MTSARCVALAVLFAAAPALAQPMTGQVQPDRLSLGTVYIGSTVEASFMVYEAGQNANIKFDVTAPKFVKVLDKTTEARTFGKGNNFVCGIVQFSIDTSAEGELSGTIEMTLGKTTAKLPVSATVKKRRPGLSHVLIVETPFDCYSTKDGTMFDAWTNLVAKSPLDVSYLLVQKGKPVLRDLDLGKFDCVFLAESGLYSLTADDVKRARAYAEKGGRVVVTANYFFRGTVAKANEVLEGYGLALRDEEARGGQKNDVVLGKGDLDERLVKAGIESAHFFRASPAVVTDAKKARVLARAVGVGEPGDAFVVVGKAGKGEVIAIGQSLWWNWISEQRAKGSDNPKLLRWLLVPRGGS